MKDIDILSKKVVNIKSKEPVSETKENLPKTSKIFEQTHIHRYDANRSRPKHLWAIQGLIPFKSTNIILGKEGNGKTFLAIDLACHLAHGLPFMGLQVKKCAILYILGEGGFGFENRIDAWYQHHQDINSENVPIYIRNIPYQFDVKESAQECRRMVAELIRCHPDMEGYAIFIDTLNRNLSNDADENSNKGMGGFVNNIINTLSCMDKVFCFALYHKNKQGKSRGHSSLEGNADNIWECTYNSESLEAKLSIKKAKESQTGQNYLFKAHKIALPHKDEYDNPIETLVMEFDKKLTSQSDGDKDLSEHDKAYFDVLVHLVTIVAEAKRTDSTSLGIPMSTWNSSAKSKGIFADQKTDFRRASAVSRTRLEKKGFIKIDGKLIYLTKSMS